MNTTEKKSHYTIMPVFPALLKAKCARCRVGDMFKGPSSNKMYDHCNHCGLTFERNPGYFYTAMYVTYVFNVIEIITLGVATFILSGGSNNPWLYLAVIIPGILLLSPLNFRYSRVIQMYWLDPTLKYDPHLSSPDYKETDL